MPATGTSPTRFHAHHLRRPLSSSSHISARHVDEDSHDALPPSLTRSLRSNPTPTSVAPSTAQGEAIPVDDSTAQHRTSSLRRLNSHYSSRHQHTKPAGAQFSTYSEPVIVRSYHGPAANRCNGHSRRRHGGRGGAGSSAGASSTVNAIWGFPFVRKWTLAGSEMLGATAAACPGQTLSEGPLRDAHLPPLEAFSFKGIMASLESQPGGNEAINFSLDRIAEICAGPRYSLSNQYEFHHTPHRSAALFVTATHGAQQLGPTLQAVSYDDDDDDDDGDELDMMRTSTTRRRRRLARRNSRAMGTLETIISSSRSSEEERSRKNSASEVAAEIYSRAARKTSGRSTPASSSSLCRRDGSQSHTGEQRQQSSQKGMTRPSASLVLVDGSIRSGTYAEATTPRPPTPTLVIEPAFPRASNMAGLDHVSVWDSHLLVQVDAHPWRLLLSTLGRWMPRMWSSDSTTKPSSLAACRLRALLEISDRKSIHSEAPL